MNIIELKTNLQEETPAPQMKQLVLETGSFYIDLLKEINQAQNRIWFQTMAFENGHFSQLFTRSLIKASQKGIDVQFISDAFSDFVTNNSFNHIPTFSRKEEEFKRFTQQQTNALIKELERSNIRTNKTNIPHNLYKYTPLPGVMGRDHKKIIIIDNKAYIGGVNFTELDAKRIDFMIKTNNPSVVRMLAKLFSESICDTPQTDKMIYCDPNNTLLVDGGEPGRSIIMQNAYELIDNENSDIVLISPYKPSGKLANRLNKAVKRGVKVMFITSSRDSLVSFAPRLSQFVHNIGTKKPLFSTYYVNGIVHAKALLAYGNKETIVGSHNFDDIFVRLGTEEISLRTREPDMISELDGYIKSLMN